MRCRARSADRPRIFTHRLPISTSISHTGVDIGTPLVAPDATGGSGARSTNAASITSTLSSSVLGTLGATSNAGTTSLPSRYCLRHPNTTLALMSCRRATIDTDMPGSNVSLITCCLNSCAYVRWGWARLPVFGMADWLRQSKRAHHALEKSASGNGTDEPVTELPHVLEGQRLQPNGITAHSQRREIKL